MPTTDPTNRDPDLPAGRADPDQRPGAVIPGAVVTEKPVDHLSEIENLANQLSRASPSGAETLVERIKLHVASLRGGGPAGTFATKHESLVADDKITGAGRTATEVQRSGVALPAGVGIHDRSEDGKEPPVPVAPADPQDVDEALQTGKSVASPVVVQPVAPVQTGLPGGAPRRPDDGKAEQDRQTARLKAERDQADRERAAAEERARLARVAPDHQSPNPDTPPRPPVPPKVGL